MVYKTRNLKAEIWASDPDAKDGAAYNIHPLQDYPAALPVMTGIAKRKGAVVFEIYGPDARVAALIVHDLLAGETPSQAEFLKEIRRTGWTPPESWKRRSREYHREQRGGQWT